MSQPPIEPVLAEPPPLPNRAVLRQRWTELAYFHWPYDPDVVQRLLPDDVRVDTFDDAAWVGLIPFVMRDVRIGPTPAVPYLGTFVEINVRTYVVDPLGRRSVWFFSLDVPRSVIVAVARTVFALPYCWSRTEYHADATQRRYAMTRRRPHRTNPSAEIEFTIGDPIDDVTDLDHFLTARWSLLTARRHRLLYGRVHHQRWPLHHVDDHHLRQSVVEAAGLPSPTGAPHTACCPRVDVDVGWLERMRSVSSRP
jgi:uncharacterized protein YqjF (DUF2071 family)